MSFYVYDSKSDIERERLLQRDKRTSLRRSIALEGINLQDGSSILDVGSGTGVLGFDLITRFPTCSLYSVDLEPSILVEAKGKSPDVGISEFIASDAYQLPFSEFTFDVCCCQYLLQHLADPVDALVEMRRVGKQGALAIVFEWDDGANFIYPDLPGELDRVFTAKAELIYQGGGDRNIGRKLYHHLLAAGWHDVKIQLVYDIWQGAEDRSAALKGTELSLLELKAQMIDAGLVTEAEFNVALNQLYDFYNDNIFSVVVFFAAFAINPA